MPEYLYKYRPINIHTIRTILHSEAYFSSPRTFNDPFDCQTVPLITDNREELIRFGLTYYKGQVPGNISAESFARMIRKFGNYSEIIDTLRAGLLTEWRNNELPNIAVYCLSEIRSDILMFSHYSDQHRGVCIEFKVTQDTFYQDMVQVEYGNYPTIKLADFPNRNASWLNAELASKFSGWGHEKEWRLLRMNGPKVYSFPEQLLTGVIFACNTSDEDKRLIMELAKKRQHPLKFYQAKKNNGDYSLDIVPE